MKLTDYVAHFIAHQDVKHAFVLQGGAALHLIDSIEKHSALIAVAMQHEQASAMAADGYARAGKKLGVTISTSGPGATNLLTGIACSYFDSVPTLHITGNVASFRQSDDLGVRQYGFQETDIVSMAKPITKYAVRLKSPQDIIDELPKAVEIALSGRPGPVLIDIPDDFQREFLQVREHHFFDVSDNILPPSKKRQVNYQNIIHDLKNAERPLLIFGAGLLRSRGLERALLFAKKFQLPFLTTWPVKGISDANEPLNLGSFGTHSLRGNNIVLQNADFILSIGCRLDSRATAKLDTFARKATLAMVDIDEGEIDKFEKLSRTIHHKLNLSCAQFFDEISQNLEQHSLSLNQEKWRSYITFVRKKLNFTPKSPEIGVDPYTAAKFISSQLDKNEIIVVDTGTCLPLTLVYGEEKVGQRYISSYNNTPMGYALPAAIGAHFASGKRITCITGDGGLQMNVQELATVATHQLPITIWVYNNAGHCMIKQTQDDWLESMYYAADLNYGLPTLNFTQVANGYHIESTEVKTSEQMHRVKWGADSPFLVELQVSPDFRYEPIIKYGNPLENMSPLMPQGTIDELMIIPSLNKKQSEN